MEKSLRYHKNASPCVTEELNVQNFPQYAMNAYNARINHGYFVKLINLLVHSVWLQVTNEKFQNLPCSCFMRNRTFCSMLIKHLA